jgi:hypothetical protein
MKSCEWRPIPSCPDYEISEYGDIRRVVDAKGFKAGRIVRGRIRKGKGYQQAKLVTKTGKQKEFFVHRLVAEAFIGPCPSDKNQIAHFDGNRLNNHWSNLRWATPKENGEDSTRHQSHWGERGGRPRLTTTKVSEARSRYRGKHGGVSQLALAREFGVSRSAMGAALTKKSWRHVGTMRSEGGGYRIRSVVP